jgi:recombination protein RecT
MTSIATVDKKHAMVTLFESDNAKELILPFLPEGANIDRVIASVRLAIANDKTKTLGKCTPQSLVLGVARIQQWGLELGVTAHLLPFGGEATPVADYKGLAELMVSSGSVKYVETHVVYEGDEFSYRLGLNPQIDHVPANPRKKGAAITYAYCILHLPFARFAFDVMNAADIEEIRQKYSKQWKNGPLPAWYAKKTVVRQVAKLVPRNPRLAKMLAVMEEEREVEFDAVPDAKRIEALRDEDEITVPREPGEEAPDEFEPPY